MFSGKTFSVRSASLTLSAVLSRPRLAQGPVQLSLQSADDIDQAIQADPSVAYILFELLDSVHASTLSNARSPSCASFAKFRKMARP
jgi:hypothetical protein